ncbi:zinc-binding dehydrogenase [Streptomyces malaysiensis]|uniref:zinc-binding dehydrogenase n=1 Tax=Streptomyces malaysiensis TaxID=92644 RepID=UPI00372267A2
MFCGSVAGSVRRPENRVRPAPCRSRSSTSPVWRPTSSGSAEHGTTTRCGFWASLTDGRLRSPIAARFPLAEAAQAHELMEQGTDVVGRILLKPGR